MSKLGQRVIVSIVLIPLLALAVWFDEPLSWFTLVAVFWGGLAVTEFYKMADRSGTRPLAVIGLIATLALIVSPHFKIDQSTGLILALASALSFSWLVLRQSNYSGFASWAWTMGGILYVGLLLSLLVELRTFEYGREWVLLALLITFTSDSAAFLIGKSFGKRRLAPLVSPKKTWEGAIGGVVFAAIVSPVLVATLHLPTSIGAAILLGIAISAFGQMGDLSESLIKRSTGTKDSSNAIPGHGGFLDRIDSIVFASLVIYCFVLWFID